MIGALVRILWLGLKRDRITLLFTFFLPVVFFSIFALIFRNMGGAGGGMPAGGGGVTVVIVDQDATAISSRFIDALAKQDGLSVQRTRGVEDERTAWTYEDAIDHVYRGRAPVAVVVRAGFGENFANFISDQSFVEIIHDPANPLAQYVVSGLVQAAAFQAAPDVLMERGFDQLEIITGDAAMTDAQRRAIDRVREMMKDEVPPAADGEDSTAEGPVPAGFTGLIRSESWNVRSLVAGSERGETNESFSTIPYYAAGIGVMFLLFSMSSAAGSLIKEAEIGTLDRVLTSNITITTLLASKWVFYAGMGFVQVFIMFAWAAVFFELELWTVKNFIGFVIMTAATAASASAFGMMLATICRSRGQLDGISAVVILMMSAVGGSMVPRFIMPQFMQDLSNFTFNGQALNGYLNVFWHARPEDSLFDVIVSTMPSVAALGGMCVVFLFVSRVFARRWEAA